MIDYRIMGVPKRMDNIRLLQEQLSIDDSKVFLDTEYRRNPMWTWKQTTKGPNEGHLCIIQDDAILCNRFKEFCEYLVNRFTKDIIVLYNDKDMSSVVPKYCILQPNCCIGGVAMLIPSEYIDSIIEEQERDFPNYIHDDNWITFWTHKHRVKIYCTYPSVVNTKGEGVHKERCTKDFCTDPMNHHWANATSIKWSKRHNWTKLPG